MISHEEKMKGLSPERRARIENDAQEMLREYEAIQALRKQLGVTQKELAERMNVGQAMISKLENGEIKLTLGNLSRIIEALSPEAEWEINIKVPGNELFTIAGKKDRSSP